MLSTLLRQIFYDIVVLTQFESDHSSFVARSFFLVYITLIYWQDSFGLQRGTTASHFTANQHYKRSTKLQFEV